MTLSTVYLFVIFITTIVMCIGLYIKLTIHLRSTLLSSYDRTEYLKMRSITHIALMQSLFPIFTYLPTTIEFILIIILPDYDTFYNDVIAPSPILTFILELPYWTQPYSAILIALSIILALGEIRQKTFNVITYIPNKLFSKSTTLFKKNKVHGTTINVARSTMIAGKLNTRYHVNTLFD